MSAEHKVVVKGIIVGRRSAGEGSVRVVLYSDKLGLISALAKSGREERSQLRAHLQLGTFGTFSLVKGRDVWRLTGVMHDANAHFACAENPAAQEALSRVLAFVRQFVRGEGSDPYFFEVLWGFVSALPFNIEEALKDAERVAVFRMLASLGYVEASSDVSRFLPVSYAPEVLADVHATRVPLTAAINEGISASGL